MFLTKYFDSKGTCAETPLAVIPACPGWRVAFAEMQGASQMRLRLEPMTHLAILGRALQDLSGMSFGSYSRVRPSRPDGTAYGLYAIAIPPDFGTDEECLQAYLHELQRSGVAKTEKAPEAAPEAP